MKVEDATVVMCFHCGNETLMPKVAEHVLKESQTFGMDETGRPQYSVDFRTTWNLYLCPVCRDVTLHVIEWCSEDDPLQSRESTVLYPHVTRKAGKIPDEIYSAYSAAMKVRRIDSAICALSLRRTLEMMCKDFRATGKDLYSKLKELSERGVLPPILSEMGDILKLMGNAAAHGDDAEFDDEIILSLIDFTQIILDYVYNIPANLEAVQQNVADKGFRKRQMANGNRSGLKTKPTEDD